jgi:hypothetical protein
MMEILAILAVCVVVNALIMAQIMKRQAGQIRGWRITHAEALSLQARSSMAALLCVLLALLAIAWLPQVDQTFLLGFCLAAYFIPYYLRLLRVSYLLTWSQKDRGRGVARGNIRQIVHASFGYAALIYAIGGGVLYMIWRSANAG